LAVERNKAKRWVREVFKGCYKCNGYVVVIGPGFLQKGYKNISIDFKKSLANFVNKAEDD